MYLIEFTGIQGSGKSTIVPILKRAIRQQGLKFCSQRDLIKRKVRREPFFGSIVTILPKSLANQYADFWFKFRNYKHVYRVEFCKAHPDLLSFYKSENAKRDIPRSHKTNLVKWMIDAGGKYAMAKDLAEDDELFSLDEGFFHKIINLFLGVDEEVPTQEAVQSYMELIPELSLLCQVDADYETANIRVSKRGKPKRFKELTDEEFAPLLKKAAEIIDLGKSLVNCNKLTIDNKIQYKNDEEFIAAIEQQLKKTDFISLLSLSTK